MNNITKILFLLLAFPSFSQTATIKGRITGTDDFAPFPAVQVSLVKDNKIISETKTDYDGNYAFQTEPGNYEIRITDWGHADKIIPVELTEEIKIVDTLYPDPCVENAGICPYHHTDYIIPIIYGLPTKKALRLRKRGKIVLGGCFGGCVKWYCKKHHVSF